jgi:formylglycine-generating enzyme required for sulfatase activity
MRGGRTALIAACAWIASCNGASPSVLPPQGEVLLVVDTDMPVPAFVNRLRVDAYDASGGWYLSRDTALPSVSDWPASFALDLGDTQGETLALVRLRAYAEGRVRDYRGERFAPFVVQCDSQACAGSSPPACCPLSTPAPPKATGSPRLFDDAGNDITPPTEPDPALAIDRLVVLDVLPDRATRAVVVLRGACTGTMADVAGIRSCTDTTGQIVDASSAVAVDGDLQAPVASQVGTFHGAAVPCTVPPRPPGQAADGSPLHDEEVCVPGGMFVFGDASLFGLGPSEDDTPPRIAIVPPFLMDKYEVSVARWRDALARGFVNPDGGLSPVPNESALPTSTLDDSGNEWCTWTRTRRDREDYGVTCLAWKDARAFCQFLGGDLPTEVQFEYAAMAAGRDAKTRYAWGGDDALPPTCTRAGYGRGTIASFDDECNPDLAHTGPVPVEAFDHAGGDVMPSLGVVDLGGNYAEWLLDDFAPLTANCWASAPLLSPSCTASTATTRAVRGGDWRLSSLDTLPSVRSSAPGSVFSIEVGVRCARAGSTQ